jgi:uncharacterized FlaG/YvyC family protein
MQGPDARDRAVAGGTPRARPRWIFQVDTNADRTVLRVFDATSRTVHREIPIEEFLAYARRNRDVTPFLLAQLPGR